MANQTQQGKLGFASEGGYGESIWRTFYQRQDVAVVESAPQRQYQRNVAFASWNPLKVLGEELCCIGEEGKAVASSDGCHPQLCWDLGQHRTR